MWNNSKSLTAISFWNKIALWVWILSVLPVFLNLFLGNKEWFLLIIYLSLYLPVFLIGLNLFFLLQNIQKGIIFSKDNLEYLRRISWACLFAGIFLLLAGLYQWIFIILSAMVGFFGLLMRVIKNMLNDAIRLKEENDYTI